MNELCVLCGKDRWNQKGLIEFIKGKDMLCGGCRKSFRIYNQSILFHGIPMYIVYVYNDFLASSLFQFKSGDSKLAPIFFYEKYQKVKKLAKKKTCIIPPSTQKKTEERGFIPIEYALKEYEIKVESLFMKQGEYEQKKSKHREEVEHQIRLLMKPKQGSYVLIDDVVTSGTTLKACLQLLQEKGIEDIEIFVLSATESFIQNEEKSKKRGNGKKLKIVNMVKEKIINTRSENRGIIYKKLYL